MGKIFAIPFSYLLSFLYGLVDNYGIAIIILSIIVRGALYPLYKKQILSTAGMASLQPKMRELQRKYANDKETLNIKMAELYKEENVNPAAGCLPMIIQMFVIMGLFVLLRNPLQYMKNPEMFFAVHQSFLWIKDLSQPDLWILPILSGIATFIAFTMSSQNNLTGAQQPGGNVMNSIMKYFFPIMIVWLARTYPSGLAIYWFISQFMQIFFNLRFNQIRKEINKGSKKMKKKAA